MNPPDPALPWSLDDDLDPLAALIANWEPHLQLVRPDRGSVVYEPEGTLYAIALSDGMTVRTDRREIPIRAGDALVIPSSFAIDAGPEVDLIALRYDGPPPDHFRERFLQVWGFEHLPCPPPGAGPGVFREIIPAAEIRHRVPYAWATVGPGSGTDWVRSEELTLVVGFDGRVVVAVEEGGTVRRVDLILRKGFVVGPGLRWSASGAGTIGALSVVNEISHMARRARAGRPPSPEYQPPGLG